MRRGRSRAHALRVSVLCLSWLAAALPATAASRVHQTPAEFIEETFASGQAQSKVLWIAGDLEQEVRRVMGHTLGRLRVRYWVEGQRTAWVLEEIGKVEPITVGIAIHRGRIERLKILVYRESRGWEVENDFFTNQFLGAQVATARDELTVAVEGISGATLSVDAVKRLARLALVLDRRAEHIDAEPVAKPVARPVAKPVEGDPDAPEPDESRQS